MEIREILLKIGLSEQEISVYLALLEKGPSLISDISKWSGEYRTEVYKTIPKLEKKGLVYAGLKGKRRLYSAASPEKLSILLSSLTRDLDRILPGMLSTFDKKELRPTVVFLEGANGIRSVYDDIVSGSKKGDVFYRYSSSRHPKKRDKYVSPGYEKRRDEKQLERYVITNESSKKWKKPKFEKAVKIIPKGFDLFEYDVTLLIYGNKIAFVDYNSETSVIIENPMIAEFQRKIFKLLFSKL